MVQNKARATGSLCLNNCSPEGEGLGHLDLENLFVGRSFETDMERAPSIK